jgi:hypothetical protein
MSSQSSEFWSKARRARDKLTEQFLRHPEVSLIDIGYDSEAENEETAQRIVLRVHVRRPLTREALGLPAAIEGLPVRVVVADYKPE